MNKRGQLAIFVIIAIVLVASVVGYFILRGRFFVPSYVDPEVRPIADTIETCVYDTLEDGTRMVGLQGGYVIAPGNALETDYAYVAYGAYLGEKMLPSKDIIEREIGSYIDLTVSSCMALNDFTLYNLELGVPEASVKIEEEVVSASVRYPFSASKGTASYAVDQMYSQEVDIRLGKIYIDAQEIIDRQINDPENIDLGFISDLEYDVEVLYHTNDILIYNIEDNAIEDLGPYLFRFAVRLR